MPRDVQLKRIQIDATKIKKYRQNMTSGTLLPGEAIRLEDGRQIVNTGNQPIEVGVMHPGQHIPLVFKTDKAKTCQSCGTYPLDESKGLARCTFCGACSV